MGTVGMCSAELHTNCARRGVVGCTPAAFFVAIPAGVLLILAANGPTARAAASVYVATVLLLFGTSAGYHMLARSPRARGIMQRLDHSMIYLLITGTYVPMCLVALPPAWGIPLLVVVGVCAVVGVVLKLTAFRVRWVGHALYPAMGWASVAVAPAFVRYMTAWPAGAARRRRTRLHDRDPGVDAEAPRSVAACVRLPRGVAQLHGRRRGPPLRRHRHHRQLSRLATFDIHVVVDWSAAGTAKRGRDSIWCACAGVDRAPNPINLPTRFEAAAFLDDLITSQPGRRILIGFDFPFGYPSGTATALGLTGTPWRATWDLLTELITDDHRNANNRFDVAAELNGRLGARPGPFWGCPASRQQPGCAARSPRSAARSPSTACASVSSVPGAGARSPCGSCRIPAASAVRRWWGSRCWRRCCARMPHRVEVWPFTTGLGRRPAAGRPDAVVLAEVWPSRFATSHAPDVVRDASQVTQTSPCSPPPIEQGSSTPGSIRRSPSPSAASSSPRKDGSSALCWSRRDWRLNVS